MAYVGRPTDYTDDMLEKARAYVDGGWRAEGHKYPSIIGLRKVLNRSRSTLYNWMADPEKAEFLDITDDLMDEQQLELTDNGLDGTFNAAITKLMLTKHGYSDKQELSGNEGGPIQLDTNWTVEVIEPKDSEE